MSDEPHISDTVSAGQLRAFIERIERVEEEIRELNADKSEIYKELRGVGFDVKAVRQCVAARKLDSAEREERTAIFDMYWTALTGASRVHVHEATQSYAEAKGRPVPAFVAITSDGSEYRFDPETGELTDTQEQPETATQSDQSSAPAGANEDAGTSSDENPAPISPSAAPPAVTAPVPQAPQAGAVPLHVPASPADDDGHPGIPTGDAREAGAGTVEPLTFSQSSEAVTISSSVTPPPPGETDRAGAESSPASASNFDNPRCQTPDGCTFAHSRNSCWECTMAWATRPKDEQIRLWQEAMEAASETEAA